MNWKRFKQYFAKDKIDESSFILGIDLGNATSALAYLDVNTMMPTVVDISGGYGKPTVPTAMQYINDSKEWVFGEYAMLNSGASGDITVTSLIERLGKREYIEIGERPVSVVNVLSYYLKELIGNIKNINPKAEIAGIIVSIPSYLSDDVKDELMSAFKNAGYEKELIEFVPDRECVFAHYLYNKKVNSEKIESQKVMLLDFASRELRGGVYQIIPEENKVSLNCLSSVFSESVGTDKLDEAVSWLFTQIYCINMNIHPSKISRQAAEQLKTFVYQHKDLLFQKNLSSKPVRLYFNFAYPPFQQAISKADVDEITSDYKSKFITLIGRTLEKNIYNNADRIPASEIGMVICTGGGFEMLWAREIIAKSFPGAQILYYKNSKSVIAEGAAVIAASELGVLDLQKIITEDRNQITSDIGIKIIKDKREKFIPIIEKNTFWWQTHMPKMLIINDGGKAPALELFQRDIDGDIKLIDTLLLDGLPKRPKGTTKIKMSLQFVNYREIEAVISDCGFGEIFPQSDYSKKFICEIRDDYDYAYR